MLDYKNSLLVSAYYKSSTDLITAYQYKDSNPLNGDSTVYNTYINSNSSQAYGLELTSKNKLASWWDVLADINLYDTSINGSNTGEGLNTERVSGFFKLNNSFKVPRNFSAQLSGDYQTKSVLPQLGNSSGRGNGSGITYGGNIGAATVLSAQGYVNPNYGVDAAIKKDFGKDNIASLTLSVNDFFRTGNWPIIPKRRTTLKPMTASATRRYSG